jgi:hypothetical protein
MIHCDKVEHGRTSWCPGAPGRPDAVGPMHSPAAHVMIPKAIFTAAHK